MPVSKKSLVSKKTVQKWIQGNDKSFSTLVWLSLEMDADGDGISLLRCKIYCKFKERLELMRNFCLNAVLMLKR